MYKQGLNKEWKLRYEKLYYDKDYYAEISEKKDGWYDVEALPCDIHIPLIEKGEIGDPVIADNCYKCEWRYLYARRAFAIFIFRQQIRLCNRDKSSGSF